MANLLDRFNEIAIGSRGSIADYSSVIGSSGDFTRVTNFKTILLSWNNILFTPTRSYNEDPEYGCDLYKLIFDPADKITEDKIKNEIITKLLRYDDRATISKIQISFLTNKKGFNVDIQVKYKGIKEKLQITIDESSFFNI